MTRVFILCLLALLSAPFVAAQSEAPAFTEGKDYSRLPQPVRTLTEDEQVEVVEVFAYSCGHCFKFEPLVQAWKKQAPEAAVFRRVPFVYNPATEIHGRAFYTAKALGVLEELHNAIFSAIHVEGRPLASEQELADLFADHGVDPEKFKKTFNSFAVTSQVKQAQAKVRSYRITGTPEMVVAGTYHISPRGAGGHTNMLQVVDYLVARETQPAQEQAQAQAAE